jgi:hypothetical protein
MIQLHPLGWAVTPEAHHNTFASSDADTVVLVSSFAYRNYDQLRGYKKFQQVVIEIPITFCNVALFRIYE